MVQKFLSRKGAADYVRERGLKISPGTLQKMASSGGGPKYRRWGNSVVYEPKHLDQWMADKLSPAFASTSEAGTYDPARRGRQHKAKPKAADLSGDQSSRPS